jgi:signal peptidase I
VAELFMGMCDKIDSHDPSLQKAENVAASNPSIPVQNSNQQNWLSSCVLMLLAVFFGLLGMYDLIYGSLVTYIFFSARMLSSTTIAIILLIACDCMIYFVLAFRIRRQRWYVSAALLAVVWLVLSLPLAYLINTATMRVRSDGYSMAPALADGNYVLADRQAYQRHLPQRGDVIIFQFPMSSNSDTMLTKRIIGLPGETIKIDQGQVWVNGAPLHESYISEQAVYKGEWKVPQDQYFVLGDNRNESKDSHQWGFLPRENIVAKAVWIYLPFDQFGKFPDINFEQ